MEKKLDSESCANRGIRVWVVRFRQRGLNPKPFQA